MLENDPRAMEALDKYLMESKDNLGNLLNELNKHNDGSHPFQILWIFGKFVFKYCEYREENVETDSFSYAMASTANDPLVANFVAQMMQAQIDKRFSV
tara:strand:- start:437 stop:730 length:294 start_codon:yes stop_codon:yes gene_type:complete